MKISSGYVKTFVQAIVLSGIITFFVGLCHSPGIPYQDPTVEMQIQYAIDSGVSSSLVKTGLILTFIGVVATIIAKKALK